MKFLKLLLIKILIILKYFLLINKVKKVKKVEKLKIKNTKRNLKERMNQKITREIIIQF